jgi:hypothetical protein
MAFTFKLEPEDGTPADQPVLHTAVPTWQAGDTIPIDAERATSPSGGASEKLRLLAVALLRALDVRPG